jgi:hypothetical protein
VLGCLGLGREEEEELCDMCVGLLLPSLV